MGPVGALMGLREADSDVPLEQRGEADRGFAGELRGDARVEQMPGPEAVVSIEGAQVIGDAPSTIEASAAAVRAARPVRVPEVGRHVAKTLARTARPIPAAISPIRNARLAGWPATDNSLI